MSTTSREYDVLCVRPNDRDHGREGTNRLKTPSGVYIVSRCIHMYLSAFHGELCPCSLELRVCNMPCMHIQLRN